MGASVGTGDGGKSVDVELNVVPFIDLMSCLTAFLLVTAQWVQFHQLPIAPKGISRSAEKPLQEDIPKNISILVTEAEIWAGTTLDAPLRIPMLSEEKHDWGMLAETLQEIKASPVFAGKLDIEVAAEDAVPYQAVVYAMDVAIESEFPNVGYMDPRSLSVKFRE